MSRVAGMPSVAVPCSFSAATRLLVVAPHPDDETIANGLLIQQVRAAGGAVGIVVLTDGDNNPWPQRWMERRLRIGAADRARWGVRRQAELLQALQRLDVPPEALQKLHWPDMGVTARLLLAPPAAIAELAAAIADFRPDIVAAPALGDRHPDHGAAHVLVRLALAQMPAAPTLLTYLVHGRDSEEPMLDIEGSATQQAAKRFALAAHRSQLALSAGRLQRLAGRRERFAGAPPHRDASGNGLPWRPSAGLRPWLRLSVVSAAGAQTWRWQDAPLQRDGQGCYYLQRHGEPEASPHFARLSLALPSPWIFDYWGWCEL